MSEEEECSNNATSTELENKAIEQNVFEVICKDDVARNDHVDDQDNMSPTNAMCQVSHTTTNKQQNIFLKLIIRTLLLIMLCFKNRHHFIAQCEWHLKACLLDLY